MDFKPLNGIRPQGVIHRSRGQVLEEYVAYGKQWQRIEHVESMHQL